MTALRDGELETAAGMLRALEGREITATELAERALARAEAWQPSTNAFSILAGEAALEEAGRRDAVGDPVVPIAVKDLFDVAGLETSGCCRLYRGRIAARDAPTVAAVRRRTVIVGKTNQHEMAAGGTNLVTACGRTGNPWDPGRMTGGSSGGSGAAVAAGIVPWALGSDTGGSIRIPSAMCGMFGLKPTTGRLSLDGLLPLAPSLDCPGPMARTAADLAMLLELMGGDPPAALPDVLRVGVPDGYFASPVHDEVLAAVEATAGYLRSLGAEVEPADGRGIEEARKAWMRVCTPEFADAHPAAFEHRDLVDPAVLAWLDMGAAMSPEERAAAASERAAVAGWFAERLATFDALLIPTTPYPAPGAADTEMDLGAAGPVALDRVGPGWISCTVNLAGLPALNLPAGVSRDGLPVGVSLVGRSGADGLLLALALAWEDATGYAPRQPPLPA